MLAMLRQVILSSTKLHGPRTVLKALPSPCWHLLGAQRLLAIRLPAACGRIWVAVYRQEPVRLQAMILLQVGNISQILSGALEVAMSLKSKPNSPIVGEPSFSSATK